MIKLYKNCHKKKLLLLKRNRTDELIKLLERLEKEEKCIRFKEFDLYDYIQALGSLKIQHR